MIPALPISLLDRVGGSHLTVNVIVYPTDTPNSSHAQDSKIRCLVQSWKFNYRGRGSKSGTAVLHIVALSEPKCLMDYLPGCM